MKAFRGGRAAPTLALVLATATLGGCWPLPRDPQVLQQGDATLLVAGSLDGGMDAAIAGTVAVLPGGCVGVRTQEGAALLAWPAGSRFADSEPLAVRLPDGLELHVGDKLTSGGGILRDSPKVPDVPDGCSTGGEVFVLNDVRKG